MVRDGARPFVGAGLKPAPTGRAPAHHEGAASARQMSALAHPLEPRRAIGDLFPAAMLIAVVLASTVILCLLAVVLWLAFTRGSPGGPALAYTAQNFLVVFSDQRTYSVLVDTF